MRVITLYENTCCRDDVTCGHGLSQYIETANHKILLDMGRNDDFAVNAEALGVDLAAVDVAVLSHGHNDHSGGLKKFLEINDRAVVYLQERAFGGYYAVEADGSSRFLGVDPALQAFGDRIRLVRGVTVIDEELVLFDTVTDAFPTVDTSVRLKEKLGEGYIPDRFFHEHNLIVRENGKAVVFGGCAHRGIVNIRDAAATVLGRAPDAMVSGFHLFNLTEGNAAGDALIRKIGTELATGGTVYYTGHCTGDHAYGILEEIMGGQLRRLTTGGVLEI